MGAEILVVGGGPAGSTTARLLAEAGYEVLLVEGKQRPLDKTCAGGVTARAAKHLSADFLDLVTFVVCEATFAGQVRICV